MQRTRRMLKRMMSGCDRMQRTLRKRQGNEPILLTVCEGDFQEVRRLVEKEGEDPKQCEDVYGWNSPNVHIN